MIQGSPEWFAERCGKVTASRIADVTARTKAGYGASRANYMAQLVAERLTGIVVERYSNAAMQWGMDTESEARALYQFMVRSDVEEVAFVPHPSIEMSGASPDGRVGDSGLLEIKCPNTATHINTLLGGAVAGKYLKQMQWQMACDRRQWCDFVSFDPRMPAKLQMFRQRIARDDKIIAELEAEVTKFLAELSEKVAGLTKLMEAT